MRHKNGKNIHGWLIVDKPKGMGSTQVVNLTRRLFQANKNGHTGTLDPFATGVLPIAFGETTKLIPYVTDGPKEYEFVIHFGIETESGDTEGAVVRQCDYLPSEEEIRQVLPQFLGKIVQVPPAFSAIKINGQRAYHLARKGEDVSIPERTVEIYSLELLEKISESRAKFRVPCSKGTYVRTLGQDIAKRLGSLGYLEELRRTKCGNFDLSQKILLENLQKIDYADDLMRFLLPSVTCLRDIAVIAVTEEDAAKLHMGQGLSPKAYDVCKLMGKEAVALCGENLVAIVRIDERKIAPVRVFNFI